MAGSLSDILAALQNGVIAINNLRTQVSTTFPQASSVSTGARAAAVLPVNFDSSSAVSFLAVTTSSGFTGYVALYPSS